MLGERHEIARLQSDFYKMYYHKLLRWSFMTMFIIFVMLIGIIYLILFQPAPRYYANTIEGKMLPMIRAT